MQPHLQVTVAPLSPGYVLLELAQLGLQNKRGALRCGGLWAGPLSTDPGLWGRISLTPATLRPRDFSGQEVEPHSKLGRMLASINLMIL